MRIIVLFLSMVLVQVVTMLDAYSQQIVCFEETCTNPPVYWISPTQFDFSNWDWTNQDPCNWITYVGAQRQCINPPFLSGTLRWGTMASVYDQQDYTNLNSNHVLQADKGWELVSANFTTDHPHFILYNKYRAILRPFFYIQESSSAYSHMVARCMYVGQSGSPLSLFATANDPIKALDKYSNGNNDMILSVALNGGTGSWMCADFPVLFDPNVGGSANQLAKMEIDLWGIDNYTIQISGTQESPDQYEMVTSSSGFGVGTTLQAGNAKLKKQFDSGKTFGDDLRTYAFVDPLHPHPVPQFVTTHQKKILGVADNLSKIFGTASIISEGIGVALGLFNFIAGEGPKDQNSSVNGASYNINLTGSMDVQVGPLNGNGDIKIPGTLGNGTTVTTNLYDCPMGIMNLKQTPMLWRSVPYERRAQKNSSNDNYHGVVSGYDGKYVKYRLMDDIKLIVNKVPNMKIKDVKVAFKFKASQPKSATDPSKYYNIVDPTIAVNDYHDNFLNTYTSNLHNYVYKDLQDGYFTIHKYQESSYIDNGVEYIYENSIYGTNYVGLECIKNATFELPEYTDISFSVQALFENETTHETYFFENNFAVDYYTPSNCSATVIYDQYLFENTEYWCYLYSEYYQHPFTVVLESPNYYHYEAESIAMLPGFFAGTGFYAVGAQAVICQGSAEPVDPVSGLHVDVRQSSSNCGKSQGQRTAAFESTDESDATTEAYSIYPNPSTGIVNVNLNSKTTADIHVYNDQGHEVQFEYTNTGEVVELDLSHQPEGLYLIRVEGDDKLVTKKILLTK
ncbi:MAG: hypothetical protein JWM14_1027 [Chitinophagaceae bacterium]|nr:hypothetical protein [Chitinophagaceae bacterium]